MSDDFKIAKFALGKKIVLLCNEFMKENNIEHINVMLETIDSDAVMRPSGKFYSGKSIVININTDEDDEGEDDF